MADLVITAANVRTLSSQPPRVVTYGENGITAGMALYEKSTDHKYYKAQNDNVDEVMAKAIALSPGGTDEVGHVQVDGDVNPGATMVVGEVYCVSNTAGALAPIADIGTGERVRIVGWAKSASILSLLFKCDGVTHA